MPNVEKKSDYFSHTECEYFPCHADASEEEFNCLFCFCPLYALGKNCRGNFVYTKKGIKDCSQCIFPHKRKNYIEIINRFSEIAELAKIHSER